MFDSIQPGEDVDILATQLQHLGWADLTPLLETEAEKVEDYDTTPTPVSDEQTKQHRAA